MNKLAGVNVEQDNPVQLVSSQHLSLLNIQNTTPINFLEGNINRKCYEKMQKRFIVIPLTGLAHLTFRNFTHFSQSI